MAADGTSAAPPQRGPRQSDALALFHPPTREWFERTLGRPTKAQALAFGPIMEGKSTLILAPTGSGKTLAAFLTAIDRLMHEPEPPAAQRCRVLYVSPLKALAVDIEKNLRVPLAGIAQAARGEHLRVPTVVIRTGDTPAGERVKMRRTPPDILITTPESLFLILTSEASRILPYVETVIVDEIHSLVASKRGAHLMVSLERLEALRRRVNPGGPALQRVGLSATQRPLDTVARLLGGTDRGAPRPVHIVDAGIVRSIEVTMELPEDAPQDEASSAAAATRSVWPRIHRRLVALVREHRSTLIFVNSRRLAERLAAALNEVANEQIALAHHGSVAREKRTAIEERLKRGELPAVVATSSLELGIDMGAIDLVIQVESPPSVAAGLQRIGRAGHGVGRVSRGVFFPKHRGDLLPCAAAVAGMRDGRVEATTYPSNPLDVLAQQIVAIAADGPIGTDDLYALVRSAAPFEELPHGAFSGVLDMLSGRYPSADFSGLRPRVTWDRAARVVRAREGAKRLAVANGGTIPDRGLYGVFLADGTEGTKRAKRVGELDEEMVFELREGEVFLLGASSWRADRITHDRVLVTPAAGEPGKTPFWHGDRPGRPLETGIAIGALTRKLGAANPAERSRVLARDHGMDARARETLSSYLDDQARATGELPTDRSIVVERFVDELGDFRVCVLSPFGSRVHAPWATAIVSRLTTPSRATDVPSSRLTTPSRATDVPSDRLRHGPRPTEVETVWSDDGMAFRLPAAAEPPPLAWFLFSPEEIEDLVTSALGQTSLFAAHFRECAARALLLPRRRPGQRTPLWAQRKRAQNLLGVASAYPEFPIVLETMRECLRDVFDMPGLVHVLRQIQAREIRVTTVDTKVPSPFAASLLFSFVASFIYDGDAPLAERRAQALSIDQGQLRELLGEAELRSLLDPEARHELERILTHAAHPARRADGIHDMLLAVGDLSPDEVRARVDPPERAGEWLAELQEAGRVALVRIGSEQRWVAVEDIARLRDALGVAPPPGIPAALLEPWSPGGHPRTPGTTSMTDLVGRYARTHGPFVAPDVAARFGATALAVEQALAELVRRGRVTTGAFLPEAEARSDHGAVEYCDVEVLRSLRGKSLAKLRRAVEPVDDGAYARLQIEWQLSPRRGPDALLDAVRQLEGCALPASVLESEILPARVPDYRPWDLDALCASGQIVWAGIEPLGGRDGRIMLFTPEHEPLLAPPPRVADGALAVRIRELLQGRGALFFGEIARLVGGFPKELVGALWAMVWAGEVTNDTFAPLRALAAGGGVHTKRRRGEERRSPSFSSSPLRVIPLREGAHGGGRWSLRAGRWGTAPTETSRRAAQAKVLLERYGVVTREGALAEPMCEGFSATYAVFKAMEESGRVRRGYFVAGRGATQFALPGADDRLRALRDAGGGGALVLAATDPANPYGAALPWPGGVGASTRGGPAGPQRAAGALVVLHDGVLVGWLGRGSHALLSFLPADEPLRSKAAAALAGALAALVERGPRGLRVLLLTSIEPDGGEPLAQALAHAGFTRGSKGWMCRRRTPAPSAVSARGWRGERGSEDRG